MGVNSAASQVPPSLERLLDGAHIITFPKDAPSYRAGRVEGPGRLPRGRPARSPRSSRSRKRQ